MKTVIVFQGGGALGAFGAGAWQVLSDSVDSEDIVALAGASVGAVNAAAVLRALPGPDRADALVSLWLERAVTPSWPFFGPEPPPFPAPLAAAVSGWNGVMTGLLLGARGLHHGCWPLWQPLSGLDRLRQPLHERAAMLSLLEELCPPPADDVTQPLLVVAAVDVMSGELVLFDSASGSLRPEHLAASSALPLLFEPVSIDGRLHWDGEVTRDSMLPPLFDRLLALGRLTPDDAVRLITVEQFPRTLAALPRAGIELVYRAIALMQCGKLDLPAGEIVREIRHIAVRRPPLPEDGVSGQFDYSPRRIEQLIEQGREAARQALL